MPIPQFTAGQVLTAAELNAMVDAINAGGAVKVERFTASGTWTVPAGVTYAVAYIQAGGGGVSRGAQGGTGGTSSVAFAGGTVSASGGVGGYMYYHNTAVTEQAGAANSGRGAITTGVGSTANDVNTYLGGDGALITAGAAVTPAASITVTVGAGGAAQASAGAGNNGGNSSFGAYAEAYGGAGGNEENGGCGGGLEWLQGCKR
jgi:hypothetical protein